MTITNLNKKNKYKKQKQLVTEKLRNYFSIGYDPFYPYGPFPPYKTENSYKVVFNLYPFLEEKEVITNNNEELTKTPYEKIDEFYKQQTPSVYEPKYPNPNE